MFRADRDLPARDRSYAIDEIADAEVVSGESPFREVLLQAVRTWRFAPPDLVPVARQCRQRHAQRRQHGRLSVEPRADDQ